MIVPLALAFLAAPETAPCAFPGLSPFVYRRWLPEDHLGPSSLLLIAGDPADPSEGTVRLAERLARKGFTVIVPPLSGDDLDPARVDAATYCAWRAESERQVGTGFAAWPYEGLLLVGVGRSAAVAVAGNPGPGQWDMRDGSWSKPELLGFLLLDPLRPDRHRGRDWHARPGWTFRDKPALILVAEEERCSDRDFALDLISPPNYWKDPPEQPLHDLQFGLKDLHTVLAEVPRTAHGDFAPSPRCRSSPAGQAAVDAVVGDFALYCRLRQRGRAAGPRTYPVEVDETWPVPPDLKAIPPRPPRFRHPFLYAWDLPVAFGAEVASDRTDFAWSVRPELLRFSARKPGPAGGIYLEALDRAEGWEGGGGLTFDFAPLPRHPWLRIAPGAGILSNGVSQDGVAALLLRIRPPEPLNRHWSVSNGIVLEGRQDLRDPGNRTVLVMLQLDLSDPVLVGALCSFLRHPPG